MRYPKLLVGAALLIAPALSNAVIVYDKSAGNLAAPSGDRGWASVGAFAGSSAVAIAPNFFLSSQHQGGSVGNQLELNGSFYTTIASFNVPSSDIRVWQVASVLPTYSPIFTGDPTGMTASLIGYGRNDHGTAVTTSNPTPNSHGWVWGNTAGKSWGMNTIESRYQSGTLRLVGFDFDPLTDEGTLAVNDSGGGLFVNDGGTWKLAGIHYGVQNPYSYSSDGSNPFFAAIYDGGGNSTELYYKAGEGVFAAATAPQVAASSDVSYYATTINNLIPEPAGLGLVLGAAMFMMRRRHAA